MPLPIRYFYPLLRTRDRFPVILNAKRRVYRPALSLSIFLRDDKCARGPSIIDLVPCWSSLRD